MRNIINIIPALNESSKNPPFFYHLKMRDFSNIIPTLNIYIYFPLLYTIQHTVDHKEGSRGELV